MKAYLINIESLILDPKLGDLPLNRPRYTLLLSGAAPVTVAIVWDDLWVGVIVLPNLVIAGSLRNIY